MKDSGKNDVVIPTSSGPLITKVKGLFQTLTELQIISEGEKKSGDYNPDVVAPFATRISFTSEGLHTGFHSLIFTFISLPLVIGVLKNYLPAFGKYEHDWFETIILYFLAFSPGTTKVFFTSYVLSQLYLGKTTRIMINWFLGGLITTIAIIGLFGIFGYITLYSVLLGTENLEKIYAFCLKQKKLDFLMGVYKVIYGIKMSIPKAALYFGLYAIMEIATITFAYYWASVKTKKRKTILRKYEIELESP